MTHGVRGAAPRRIFVLLISLHTFYALARPLAFFLFCLLSLALHAENLDGRMRVLYPGDGHEVSRERRNLESFVEKLLRRMQLEDRVSQLPLPEQVRTISERLAREVFREYRAGASLSDLISSGSYSDATATILTALCLEHFKIAHEAYVDHWEAYLIADPAGAAHRLRHPRAALHDPLEEHGFRREYLSVVRRTAELDLPPLTDGESDSLFRAYYYDPGYHLTFRQLSGYQQFRIAQRAYAEGRYEAVNAYLDRARLMEDRPAFDLLERAAALQSTSLGAPQEADKIDRLFNGWNRAPHNRYFATALLSQFDRSQQELLSRDELDAVRELAETFGRRAPAAAGNWADRLRTIRDIRLLEYYQQRGRSVPALQLAETLLGRDPRNPHFRTYVAELLLYDIRANYPEPADQLKVAKSAVRQHPFIADHPRYADIVLRESALRVRDRFSAGEEKAGRRELDRFREQARELPAGNDRRLWTMTAFVAASNFYFARAEYQTALDLLDEALAIDPASEFLIHQRDLIGRY